MRMPDASSETSEERKHFSFQQLYKELEELKLKVRELKDMNKKLLESKESGETPRREDLHSMYQLLFIDDFKSEVEKWTWQSDSNEFFRSRTCSKK